MLRYDHIKLEGLDDVIDNLDRLKKIEPEAAKKAAHETAEKIFETTKKFVPILEGELRASQIIEDLKDDILFGYNKEYAAKQHFDRSLNHSEGQALYFTQPIKKNWRKYEAFFEERFLYWIEKLY